MTKRRSDQSYGIASITPNSSRRILDSLRRQTAELHRAVEENSRLSALVSQEFTLQFYGDVLLRFHRLYHPLERRLSGMPQWRDSPLDFAARPKTARIERDLACLGLAPALQSNLPSDESEDLAIPDFPAALGTVYVTEGSSLGGQRIYQSVERVLGLTATSGASFFYGCGPETGPRWRRFCSFLQEQADSLGDQQPIIAAAQRAFTHFRRIID